MELGATRRHVRLRYRDREMSEDPATRRKSAAKRVRLGVVSIFAAAVLAGCDRNIEPFDPEEQPSQPDLSKIFPAGADRAERNAPISPPSAPRQMGGRGAPPVAPPIAPSPDEPVAPPIRGSIRLADGMEVPPGALLFLIARTGRSGPPLAVRRILDPSFPLDFRIGPEDRMIASVPFQGPLRITARVDTDGNATSRTPGDLQGAAMGTHDPGATGVEVVIDEVL